MTRLPNFGFPELPRFGAAAARRTGRLELSPEEEEGIARKAGRIALGGIGAVGNLLGLPGSSVVDILGGQNPLDQWLHPFSGEKRLYGRDLLRKAGMVGPQDNWKNWTAGLGVDILTDPLTYVFPFGALTKGGKVAKAAGLMPKVEALASTAAGKVVGPRTAMLKTTLGDLMEAARPEEMRALETAAKGAKVNLQDLAQEPLRGMFGTGFFGKVGKVYGTGPRAEKYAAALDKIGGTIRYGQIPGTTFSPVDEMAKLFNAKLGAVPGRLGQMFAKKSFAEKEIARGNINLQVADHVSRLVKSGFATEKQADLLRAAFEEIKPGTYFDALPPEVQQVVTDLDSAMNKVYDGVLAEGGKIDKYDSPLTKYWPRQGLADELAAGPLPSGAAPTGPFDPRNRFAQTRHPILRPLYDAEGNAIDAIKNETTTLRKLIQDKRLHAKIEAFESDDDIAKWIKEHYGDKIPDKFNDIDGRVKDRYPALARWIANMTPEQRKLGFFANNPVLDAHSYMVNGVGQAVALRNIREMLTFKNTIFRPGEAAAQTNWKTLRQAIAGVEGHLDPQTFGLRTMDDWVKTLSPDELMEFQLGAAKKAHKRDIADLVDDDLLNHFLDHRVGEETATAIGRIAKGFAMPAPANKILKALDSLSNLWKGHVTGEWPAFQTRNLVSGQTNNFLSGMWDGSSVVSAFRMLRGGVVKDAAEYPIVQQIARERGLTNLTAQQATDILGEVAYAQNTTGRAAGETMQAAGLEGVAAPQRIEDVVREIPRVGFKGTSFQRVGRKFIGREPGTSFNPLAMRGVSDFQGNVRTASRFGPAAAGEELSPFVEGMNRIQPLLYLLKRGVDPAEAGARIGRAQAMYDARYFTPFEREVMQRVFPFFKFSKQMPIWMFNELKERPGGRLAQLIRTANRARNPDVMTPDYVAETAAIPLGTDPEGGRAYLSGAGLMAEDPISFLGGGVRGGLLEAGSRMNPLVKAPLEWMTGQSFFQKGPQGGRQLEDMDPTLGRTLANLTGQREPVRWPGSEGMEFLLGNSPLSRAATTTRQLTSPLRMLQDPTMQGQFWPEVGKTAANLLTGARVTRVSPGAQDALLRERAQKLMKQAGGKTYVKTYIPEEVEAQMTPQELAEAQKLEALMNTLANRAKVRKEARQQADKGK